MPWMLKSSPEGSNLKAYSKWTKFGPTSSFLNMRLEFFKISNVRTHTQLSRLPNAVACDHMHHTRPCGGASKKMGISFNSKLEARQQRTLHKKERIFPNWGSRSTGRALTIIHLKSCSTSAKAPAGVRDFFTDGPLPVSENGPLD